MDFSSLTYLEIHEHIRSGSIAVIPTGCTEQQGPRLPVDFDTWFSATVCQAGAERAGRLGTQVLVLPVIPFGPAPEHRNFGSGYIHIPLQIHEQLISAVLDSLAEQGFQRMIIWRGCGGHNLKNVTKDFNLRLAGKCRAFLPEMPYAQIMEGIAPGIPGGHADSFCVALSLYLRPESLRTDKIPAPELAPVNWCDPQLDFSNYSSSGTIGDPSRGTREMGAGLWNAIVEEVALTFIQMAGYALT